jgi:PAS domain S-box-containing protein
MAMVFTDAKESGNPIIFANDSFLSLTGHDREGVLDRSFNFLMAPCADPEALAEIEAAFEGSSDSDPEIRYRRKDGSVFWASIYISPVRDEGGDVVQHFASFVDLTKHKQEKDRLRFLLDELNHRTQNTLATVQAIAVQTLRGEGFWLPSAPRRGLWCMCGHVRQRKRARKTVTPLLRDRVAVFDESDISESCLELDPNAKVSG